MQLKNKQRIVRDIDWGRVRRRETPCDNAIYVCSQVIEMPETSHV